MSQTAESTATKKHTAKAAVEELDELIEDSEEESADKMDPRHALHHLKLAVEEVMIKQLNGLVVGISTFLEEREKAHAAEKVGVQHTLRTLSAAHREYRTHTQHAKSDFVDHMLAYKKPAAAKKKKK
jgi:hypothetical protein